MKDISYVANEESKDFSDHMLRFLENHDEERIASEGFANDPAYALPAMIVSATLSGGPLMIYSGQEVGEPGRGNEGFGGEDSRTSIFDYWGVPEHQKWMNGGAFDGALLSEKQKQLRSFYANLFHVCTKSEAISQGKFYELKNQSGFNNRMYAYIRYTKNERVLVIANFDREKSLETTIQLPDLISKDLANDQVKLTDMLSGEISTVNSLKQGIQIKLGPVQAKIFRF
ncbi:Alpha-amylase [Arcticibacter svalbardensis MN12-7]|uniref:Alpha-amylase n=1 Tax=Arcticibacter svalbardensis MN12-7 TaxID=1150600 RepID=R9H655_9SPHI|nr:Alpha-amylase [Arcticibacter svalbardensis MN12-7]